MGASIDGGWIGAADASEEWSERSDTPERDPHDLNRYDLQGIEEEQSERQSVIDSAKGFAEFAKRRLLSLVADLAIPTG
jgi:hypothetical protein